ncbi:hypothetical protein CYMTET_28588 [Cymbomonas tetramitiformis]|uniref:Pentacotripeptide-repeat region of PRORP domain-containing protein n=1 Tax=Cymbomonas tetramitiformis TaxID=36881 RepID=A0AAE0KVR5_9CHLO|nr:hypothetical protein CYMTET_28588 [Cymbomonas tetramitiformis]
MAAPVVCQVATRLGASRLPTRHRPAVLLRGFSGWEFGVGLEKLPLRVTWRSPVGLAELPGHCRLTPFGQTVLGRHPSATLDTRLVQKAVQCFSTCADSSNSPFHDDFETKDGWLRTTDAQSVENQSPEHSEPSYSLRKLTNMVKGSLRGSSSLRDAWKLFNRMEVIRSGVADERLYTIMLKACDTSDEVRHLVRRMRSNGFSPDAFCYNALMRSLTLEGKPAEARQVLEEMQAAGVQADSKTQRALYMPSELAAKINHERLKQLLHRREVSKAWMLLSQLEKVGVADEPLYTVMLKACDHSAEVRSLKQRMQTNGISPKVLVYNALMRSLTLEGRAAEAGEVLKEMQAAGVEADEDTQRALVMPSEVAGTINYERLKQLLQRREISKAWKLFSHLEKAGAADEPLYATMLKACDNSAEVLKLKERMQTYGISPNVLVYNALMESLMLEGRAAEAKQVLEELQAAGLEADEDTERALGMTSAVVSRESRRKLRRLIRQGEVNKAWREFDKILRRGGADKRHFYVMLKGCDNCREVRFLFRRMRSKGFSPDAFCYNALLRSLMLEGKPAEAGQVLEEMQAAGVEADGYTKNVLGMTSELAAKINQGRLKQLLQRREISKAWMLFNQLERDGAADEHLYTMMLKACDNSTQVLKLKQRMQTNGISQCVMVYNALMRSLMLEGRAAEAGEVLKEMQAAGVEADEDTRRALGMTSEVVSKQNSTALNMLIHQGEIGKAWRHFDQILRVGSASIFQYNIMMKACRDSTQAKELIQKMRSDGISCDANSYLNLIKILMRESRAAEARQVLKEMQARGVKPDFKIQRALSMPSEVVKRINTTKLRALVRKGEYGNAWREFGAIMRGGSADTFHFVTMLKACDNSAEVLKLKERMQTNGISPNVMVYNALMRSLTLEGKPAEARQVLEEMQAAGVEADEDTQRALQMPSKVVVTNNNYRLNGLLQRREISKAWKLFSQLERDGAADEHLYTMMLKACDNSTQVLKLKQRMQTYGISPNVMVYNALMRSLTLKGRAAEAKQVLEEMQAAGVEADEDTQRALVMPSKRIIKVVNKVDDSS